MIEVDQSLGPRDTEATALFNAAFCAVVLNHACAGFAAKSGDAMPLTFAYLVVPSALHRSTREALPGTTATSMTTWLRDHPLVLVDLPRRIGSFREFTSRAIVFGLNHGVLATTDNGALSALPLARRPRSLRATEDWEACRKAAQFLGRWLGSFGNDEATTLAQWGIRP